MTGFSGTRSHLLLTALAIILICLSVFFLGVIPQLRNFNSKQEQIRSSKQELATLEGSIATLQQAEQKLQQIDVEFDQVVKIFPLREDSVVLVEKLEDAIARAGLVASLTIVDTKETEQNQKGQENTPPALANLVRLEEVPYSLRVSGSYRQITDLFIYLENGTLPTEFTNLSLSAELTRASGVGTTSVKTGQITAEIKGVFFIKQP